MYVIRAMRCCVLVALLGVGIVALIYRRRMRRMRAGHQQWLAGASA